LTSERRLWLPRSRTILRPGASGGIPNGSLSPCTISTGTDTASSSGSRVFSGRPGGCSGKARHRTPLAPVASAVRHATRAPEDRPPVLIPFFGFRIMVGMGLIMLAVSWLGNLLRFRGRLETTRWFLWGTFLAFPTGFIAILTGWFTAEVGRQPWVVYGLLRTTDAVTPSLAAGDVVVSLAGYVLVYAVFVSFGVYYVFKLLREGPTAEAKAIPGATGSRPMAFADTADTATVSRLRTAG